MVSPSLASCAKRFLWQCTHWGSWSDSETWSWGGMSEITSPRLEESKASGQYNKSVIYLWKKQHNMGRANALLTHQLWVQFLSIEKVWSHKFPFGNHGNTVTYILKSLIKRLQCWMCALKLWFHKHESDANTIRTQCGDAVFLTKLRHFHSKPDVNSFWHWVYGNAQTWKGLAQPFLFRTWFGSCSYQICVYGSLTLDVC